MIGWLKCLLGSHDMRLQKPELGFPAHKLSWHCQRPGCRARRGVR